MQGLERATRYRLSGRERGWGWGEKKEGKRFEQLTGTGGKRVGIKSDMADQSKVQIVASPV